jgi:hypothetical protein
MCLVLAESGSMAEAAGTIHFEMAEMHTAWVSCETEWDYFLRILRVANRAVFFHKWLAQKIKKTYSVTKTTCQFSPARHQRKVEEQASQPEIKFALH